MIGDFFAVSRTVLLINDESLYIYDVQQRVVRLIADIEWGAENFEEIVADHLKKDCKGKPVAIVNDTTDQHFKGGQKIPSVGFFDKKNVIGRKMQVAFPKFHVRGYIQMEGHEKGEEDTYLFAAISKSKQILQTFRAIKRALVPISSLSLLPVEATSMVHEIAKRIAGPNTSPATWSIFLGQHHSGALRQIVTKSGQLAMTRMIPLNVKQDNPQKWANDIKTELDSTINYLSRFGYTPDELTDLILIGEKEPTQNLLNLCKDSFRCKSFNVTEAAEYLGINMFLEKGNEYADPLHAAWIGRKKKFILPMAMEEVQNFQYIRQAASGVSALLILSALYFGYQNFMTYQAVSELKGDIQTQKSQFQTAQRDYEAEVERLNAVGFDVKLVQGAMNAYDALENEELKLINVISSIGEALGNDLRIDSLEIARGTELKTNNNANTQNRRSSRGSSNRSARRAPPPQENAEALEDKSLGPLTAKLVLSFPPTIDLDTGIAEINKLQTRLQDNFSDYIVTIEQQLAKPEYTQKISGVVGQEEEERKEDYVAEILISSTEQSK